MLWEKWDKVGGIRSGALVCSLKEARQGRTHQVDDIEGDKGPGHRFLGKDKEE